MARRRNNVIPYSRDYRRPPRWTMGLPPRKPRRPRWRFADPRIYLGATMVSALLALVILPAGSDATLALVQPVTGAGGTCRIYQIIDGDTARIWCPGRGSTSARFTGFDAPELFSPACATELVAAVKAKWALRFELWMAGQVSLVRKGTDRYGRALVAVFIDGEPLARRMIAAGHARSYDGGRRAGWCG